MKVTINTNNYIFIEIPMIASWFIEEKALIIPFDKKNDYYVMHSAYIGHNWEINKKGIVIIESQKNCIIGFDKKTIEQKFKNDNYKLKSKNDKKIDSEYNIIIEKYKMAVWFSGCDVLLIPYNNITKTYDLSISYIGDDWSIENETIYGYYEEECIIAVTQDLMECVFCYSYPIRDKIKWML